MLIAFDFDGVIVDSFDCNMNAVNQVAAMFGSNKTMSAEDVRQSEDMSFTGAARCAGIAEIDTADFIKKVFELLLCTQEETKVFEKMPEVIQTLAKDHPVAIITSSVRGKVDQILEKHNLKASVLTVVDGSNPAPKSEKILQTAARIKVNPNETIMIGDSLTDIREGKLAGAKTIAVSWGFQPLSLLSRANPDYIVNSPGEILDIIKCLH